MTSSEESGIVLVKVIIDFLSGFCRELQDKFLFATKWKKKKVFLGDFYVLEILEGKIVTGNNPSFFKIIFVVSQDKMALKKGTNQFKVIFRCLRKKRFVKATELEESYLYYSVICYKFVFIHILIESFINLMGQTNHQIFEIIKE